MNARLWACGAAVTAVLTAAAPPALAADTGLDAYDVPATPANIAELRKQGFDVVEGRQGDQQEIVATDGQARKLRKLGVDARLKQDERGRTERQQAERGVQPDGSYEVFRPYFDPTYVGTVGNVPGAPRRETIYEELIRFADENPDLIRAQEIGRSGNGKPIVAFRVTKDVRDTPRSARPAVLHIATQHAREWIVAENVRRQIRYFVEQYGKDPKVTQIVNTRELWFVPVVNPDGYDFTFTPGNRLWRKNLRELNGIPGTQSGDGVDPNRNYPESWGLDDEGSSPNPNSETYRGPSPASEPETQAIDRLFKQQDFKMLINYHSAAELLLYGKGNYVETTTPDDPIFRALSGTDADPAIKGKAPEVPNAYDPDVSAELYTTNGDTTDYTYSQYDALSWTPEMDVADPSRGAVGQDGGAPSVFEFQDSETDLQAAFEKNLPFAMDVALSADDPADPESHLGNTVADFELRPFDVSYGDPQPVSVLVKRKLGAVTLRWSINDGPEQTAPATEWQGGERFGGEGAFFQEVRGVVTGAKPGDTVRVRFSAGGSTSPSFRYTQASDSGAPVLLLGAENQKGPSAYPALPDSQGALAFDEKYEEALKASGVAFDTWDVDGRGGAPDELGVLSHYKAVIWYTGNDLLPRIAGQPGGTGIAKFGNDITLAMRAYMNEGGKLLYTGQNASFASGFPYNPQGEPPFCDATADATATFNQCVLVSDDFLQYWVGAFQHSDVAGSTGPGDPTEDKAAVAARALRLTLPFGTTPLALNGGTSADNQAHLTTALSTQSVLGERFKSQQFAAFEGPGAFSPATGAGYAVAESDDESYQRLRKTVDLTGATSGELAFKLSHEIEVDYDFVFVEARTAGQDDWTTLPDLNGHTAKDAGESCSVNVRSLHPFVDRYITTQGDTCVPEGTSGEFNAATGNSQGYQDWRVDLSAYAGKQVELSITYMQDFAVSGLGVFLDDVTVSKNGAVTETIGFEGGSLGGFAVGPPPAGSEGTTEGAWKVTGDLGLVTGPGIATADSVYLTFGFEGIREAGQRQAVMDAALKHLGVLGTTTPGPGDGDGGNAGGGNGGGTPGGGNAGGGNAGGGNGGGGTGTPGTKPFSPVPTFTVGRFRASRTGVVPVRVRCPVAAGTAGCTGTVSLRVGRSILGVTRYTARAGQTRTVNVRLTRSALRTLVRLRSRRVDVRVSNTSGPTRQTVITVRRATLKAPARR